MSGTQAALRHHLSARSTAFIQPDRRLKNFPGIQHAIRRDRVLPRPAWAFSGSERPEPPGRGCPILLSDLTWGPIGAQPPRAMSRHWLASLDHLVRGHLHDQRHREAERLGGLEIDDKFEFGGQDDWQVRRLLALEDATGVDADLAI